MKTLSSRTDRPSTSRPGFSQLGAEAATESAESPESPGPSESSGAAGPPEPSAPPSAASPAFPGAGSLTGAGLSALGAGLKALARGACALGRGGRVALSVLVRSAPVLGRGAAVLGRGAGRFARFAGTRIRQWRIPEHCGRAALAAVAASALTGVRIWCLCQVLFASRTPRASRARRTFRASRAARESRLPRASDASRASRATRPSGQSHPAAVPYQPETASYQPETQFPRRSRNPRSSHPLRPADAARPARPAVRLTARGGIVIMFGACFLGLLLAEWTDWSELADAVFFMASSLTAYYTRPGSLLPVVVSPPLLFFAAVAIEKFLVAAGTLGAFEGTLVMLASAATWLFAGTALTLTIALLRGLPREIRALVLELRNS